MRASNGPPWWSAVALLAAALPAPARGQVNTEQLGLDDRPGLNGFVEGRADLRTGNVDLTQLGATVSLRHLVPPSATGTTALPNFRERWVALGEFQFGRESGARFLHSGFAHLRYTRFWHPTFGPEAFAQGQFDEFARLKRRLLIGAGLRAHIVSSPRQRIAIGTALMAEDEQLDDGVPGPAHERVLRWSSYLAVGLAGHNRAFALTWISYIQPRIDAWYDYRLLSELELAAELWRKIDILWAAQFRYDARAPGDIEPVNIVFTPKLRLRF